jgi:hypothetical protein
VLDGARNPELYSQWLDYIVDPAVKDAFLFIVGIAAESTRYRCHVQWKGDVRDFRFHEAASDEQPHSFITNQHWLLFYFRPPAVRSGSYSRRDLEADFDSFVETPAGEWTVKLRGIDDIRRLSRHIQWRAVGNAK